MQISKITIKNFRSIKNVDIVPGRFNIFVGQNNHGKTNLFEALDWFFNGIKKGEKIEDIRFGKKGKEEVIVEVDFLGAQEGAGKMKHETNRTKIKKILDGSDNITIKRSSSDLKNRKIAIKGSWLEKIPTGFDRTLNDFLPKFEYVDTKKYFDDVAKFGRTTPIGIMLSGVLTTILEKSDKYKEFHGKFDELFGSNKSEVKIELDKLSDKVKLYLEKQFPDCTKVLFEVSPPVFEDLLKNFDTVINDGVETKASEKGDGMQRALMLAILQAFADFRKVNEDIGKSFLFFIDEAELHLHPTAQRKLKKVLLELSEAGEQVFANTHSSVLVADESEYQKIFRVEKEDGITFIDPIKELEKPYIIYELLGGSPADLLLPKNFLIVEGKSELEFLSRVVGRIYPDKPQVQLIPADGDLIQIRRSLNSIEHLFKPLEKSIYKEKTVILCDKVQNSNTLNDFLNKYLYLKTNNQFFETPFCSIEEYYPDCNNWKKDANAAKRMNAKQKVKLAKKVGNSITKQQFESEMRVVFESLKKSWALSFD